MLLYPKPPAYAVPARLRSSWSGSPGTSRPPPAQPAVGRCHGSAQKLLDNRRFCQGWPRGVRLAGRRREVATASLALLRQKDCEKSTHKPSAPSNLLDYLGGLAKNLRAESR